MARINFIKGAEPNISLGMDSTSDAASIPEGFVRYAYNTRVGRTRGYRKRPGFSTVLGTAINSDNIVGGKEYKLSNGNTRVVVMTDAGELTYVASAGGGADTSINTGYSTSARPTFVQLKDQLFMFNGTDNAVVYDGTSVKQLGITAPSAAPGASGSNAGGSKTSGASYIVAYTYYNSTTGAESSPSALATVVMGGADTRIAMTMTAADSSTADKIRIYSTVADGNELFLEAEIAGTSTSYNADADDDELETTPLELDNSRLADVTTSKGNYAVVAANRVFVVTGDNEIRYSKIGFQRVMPESFEAKAVVTTETKGGGFDNIVGLSVIGDTVIVLKRYSVGYLAPQGFNDFTISADNQFYQFVEIPSAVGALSHHAAVTNENEILFLTRENIYRCDGRSVVGVADQITATIRDLSFTNAQIEKISAVNDTRNQLIKFQVFASASDTAPTYTIVGNYQQRGRDGRLLYRWTIDRPGASVSTHPGMKAGCFIPVTSTTDGKQNVWAGSYNDDGQIYLTEDGNNDNGNGIWWHLVSRPYLTTTESQILCKKTYVDAKGNGSDYGFDISSIYDLANSQEDSQSMSLSKGGATWDAAVWDTDTWGDDGIVSVEYDTHRKAKHRQLVFENFEADEPVELFSIVDTGSGFRPR